MLRPGSLIVVGRTSGRASWSTFATGVNPAKHNIFDFLNRNLKNYLPELSSSRVNKPTRVIKIGRYTIPLSRSSVDMRRKSLPFWKRNHL